MSHFIYCFAEFHYAECRYAECRGAVTTDIEPKEGTNVENGVASKTDHLRRQSGRPIDS
jgi:hypothetical protein